MSVIGFFKRYHVLHEMELLNFSYSRKTLCPMYSSGWSAPEDE